MQLPTLFNLPSSILFCISFLPLRCFCEPQWPYNLPKHIKYFPEDEPHMQRQQRIEERIAWEQPNGVRKMSTEEGEKFFLDFWQFPCGEPESFAHQNRSTPALAETPLRPVLDHVAQQEFFLRFAVHNWLQRRDFQCPGGTRSCASIERPNSCCSSDAVCLLIEDTGLGDVGCCPSGSSCAGTISACDTDAGYTSCPDSPNGGCCIPGYSCQDVGCVRINTAVVTQTPVPPPISSTTPPPSATPTSTPTCSSGFRSCPASEGGGCCATDRACGPQTCPPLSTAVPTTTTGAAAPPVRPTSEMPSMITSDPGSSIPPDACPTGFYMCSAYYRGGCCRVGRDCDSTSCPATNSDILNTNGITIGAPPGASVAPLPTSNCANGWFGCGSDQGGGCCPNGFSCGEYCIAPENGAQNIPKEPYSMASHANQVGWAMLTVGCFTGVAMVYL